MVFLSQSMEFSIYSVFRLNEVQHQLIQTFFLNGQQLVHFKWTTARPL